MYHLLVYLTLLLLNNNSIIPLNDFHDLKKDSVDQLLEMNRNIDIRVFKLLIYGKKQE